MRGSPLVVLVAMGCAATAPAKKWPAYMDSVVGPAFDDVLEPAARTEPGSIDLAAVARAARATAEVMALGHGPLVDPNVPDFAERARAAEEHLLAIAAAAESERRAELPALIRALHRRHCIGCHEAAGVSH